MSLETDPKSTPRARAVTNRGRRSSGLPRGARSAGGTLERELPRVPRRYGQWVGAVLFVIMAMLLAGWLWQQHSDRQAVLAVARPVPAGHVITASDLRIVDVAGVRGAIGSAKTATVVGSSAAVGLVEGEILTPAMVTRQPIPGPGESVVGLQLDATRAPSNLASGDAVNVVAVPPSGGPSSTQALDSPTVLASKATVVSADLVAGTGTRLTLLVPQGVAQRVAAYVAAGRVALVQTPTGGGD